MVGHGATAMLVGRVGLDGPRQILLRRYNADNHQHEGCTPPQVVGTHGEGLLLWAV